MLIEQHFVGLEAQLVGASVSAFGHVSCGTSQVQPTILYQYLLPCTASVQSLLLSTALAPQWDSPVWISPFKVTKGYCQYWVR